MNLLQTIRRFFNRATRDQVNVRYRNAVNRSGVFVDEGNALTLASVFCAIRAIAAPLSSMPYHVYQHQGRARVERKDHPVDWILSMQPNPEMTAPDFWYGMDDRMLRFGNAYAEIERNNRGEPVALWPIEPHRVRPHRDDSGALTYVVTNTTKEVEVFDPMDMYHLRGPGDGITGYSVIGLARETIGAGLAMEQFGSTFFQNGASMGAVIEGPLGMHLSDEAIEALVRTFNERHVGPGKAANTAYIDNGMKITYPGGIPHEDAQFIEQRKVSVLDICRWFGVPPHLLYDLERATFSNIEFQALDFVTHTLIPWARRIEAQTDIKLFGRQQRGVFYSKLNFDSMLRGDIKSRFEAYGIARLWGIYSANDCRQLEEWNPYKGGDDYHVQSQLIPADLLREQAEANIEKTKNPPQPAQQQDTPSAKVLALAERFREMSQ